MAAKKWNILYIKDQNSKLNVNSEVFNTAFNKVDKASTSDEANNYLETNKYDMVIRDISVEVLEGMLFLKRLKDVRPEQSLFALVAPDDEDKLYKIAELNINAVLLKAEEFDQALEAIGEFDPYAEHE